MKKVIALFMSCCLLTSAAAAKSEAFSQGDFVFVPWGGETDLRDFIGDFDSDTELFVSRLTDEGMEKEVLVVPAEVNGKKVTGLNGLSWAGKYKKIVLPETVKSVRSFYNNPILESINLDHVERIQTFENCEKLKDIGPGNRISFDLSTSIQNLGLFMNTGLEHVTIDIESMGNGGFGSGSRESRVKLEFSKCKELRTVNFTDKCKEVYAYNFQDCPKLDYVCFGTGFELMQWRTFANCVNLRTAIFYGEPAVFNCGGIAYNYDHNPGGVFDNCPKLTIIGKEPVVSGEMQYDKYSLNYREYIELFGGSFIPAIISNGEPSTVVARAEQTATVTVNGAAVPAYTVNDSVYVGESALKSLGFGMDWDGDARTTTVTKPENIQWGVKLNTNLTPAHLDVVSSDVKFIMNGSPIPALNVGGGESIIDVNALAEAVLY